MNANNPSTPNPGRKRNLTRWLFAVKLCISIGLLFLLFRWIDPHILLERYADLRWGWLLAGVGLLLTQSMISTAKWKIILHSDGIRVPYLLLWQTYLISGFLSLFLPTSFGGDVYRVWTLNRIGAGVGKSAASVLFDRITGLWALMTIGTVGASILLGGALPFLLGSAYVVAIALFLIATSDPVIRRLPTPKNKYVRFPIRVLESFALYRRSPGRLAAVLGISGVFQFNIVLIVSCYAQALGVSGDHVSFAEMVAVVPAIYLTELLPISINGIGVRDSAFAFFFQRVGGTAGEGLAVSLLVILARYIVGTLGGFLLALSLFQSRGRAGRSGGDAIPDAPVED